MKGHKRPTSFQLFRRYIMKHLLILIIMTLSTASFAAATKTEIIEEEVCHAVAGCWVNPKNGECPDCVIETRTIVTVIEEEPIIEKVDYVPRELKFIEVEIPVKKKLVKGCTVLVAGKPRPCDWAEGDNKRAVVIERANKECGGFYKWKWTSREMKEYVCKYKG